MKHLFKSQLFPCLLLAFRVFATEKEEPYFLFCEVQPVGVRKAFHVMDSIDFADGEEGGGSRKREAFLPSVDGFRTDADMIAFEELTHHIVDRQIASQAAFL